MYDTILARSFSKHDQKKLGCGAFLGCLIIALSICFVFKPYLDPTKILNLQAAPMDAGLKMLMTEEVSNPFLPKSSPNNESNNISNDEEKSIPIRKSIPNQVKSIPNQEIIIPNEDKGIPNQESIPNEEKSNLSQKIISIPNEDKDIPNQGSIPNKDKGIPKPGSIPNEEKSNTNEEMRITNEEKGIPNQETSIANEDKSHANEEKSIPNQETSIAYEEKRNPNEEKSIPNQETSIANEEKSNPNEERSIRNEKSIPNQERNPQQKDIQTKEFKPICNLSVRRSDICQMSGDIRFYSKSSTIFVPSISNPFTSSPQNSTTTSWTIRPYARKEDATAMENVRNFTVKMVIKSSSSSSSSSSPENIPSCTLNHNVTGILFSTGGYVGNHFHEFTDVVIPLYLTSREFNGQVQFLVTNKNNYWVNKYKPVLDKLSKREIIDIDKEKEEEKVHCFPGMVVGLKQHREFSIDPSRSPHSMTEFRKFMREAYSLKRQAAWRSSARKIKKQPCLLIVARRRTRRFTNEEEIANMARRVGFRVVVTEGDSNLAKFSRIVNSCDVMMGVHGAGLTNIVFLPENGVLIQVVPLGASNWLARTYFGEPAKEMKLKYLEYKIGEEESSLREQYPPDHPVFRDPISVSKHGWLAFKEVYLDKQNVKLDVERFKPTLLEALKLLRDQ